MYQNQSILGLMPARSGSKGVPSKNIIDLGGRPLLTWVAEEASNCEEIDDFFISTDSREYADIAKAYGFKCPVLRSPELSSDTSLVIDTIIDVLKWYEEQKNRKFDYVCLIQPTACLTQTLDYTNAIKKAIDNNADTVLHVHNCGQKHPATMFTLDAEGKANWFLQGNQGLGMSRRQDLPPVFLRAGNAYVFKTDTLLKTKSLYGGSIYAVEIPTEKALDIDTPLDLKMARILFEQKK